MTRVKHEHTIGNLKWNVVRENSTMPPYNFGKQNRVIQRDFETSMSNLASVIFSSRPDGFSAVAQCVRGYERCR